jgi:hypothetical protein
MDKTLYLHIGLHKTATTLIQRFLGINRGRLEKEEGLIVPGKGLEKNIHHDIALQASVGNSAEISAKKFKRTIESFCQMGNRFVLSSEVFSDKRFIHIDLLELLNSFFSTIRVIIYLRRGDSMIESAYNQRIKRENISTPFSKDEWYNLTYTQIIAPFDAFLEEAISLSVLSRRDNFLEGK